MATIPYVWDVPYSDFTNNLRVTVYNSTGSEVSGVNHELSNGNITIQLPGYGSYRLVALDNGIRYTKHVSVNAPAISSSGGIDLAYLERYVKENSSNVLVTDNLNGTVTITVGE